MTVSESNLHAAARKTSELLVNPNVSTIFEATFLQDHYGTKADILHRDGDRWHLREVKSATNGKPELLDDLAYTTMVARRCGLNISRASLLLVSTDYRLGMESPALFGEIDRTEDAKARAAGFNRSCDEIACVSGQSVPPTPSLRFECRKCPHFETGCMGENISNHIFDLPRLSRTKFARLNDMGITSIDQIPVDFKLTDAQEIVRQSVVDNKPIIQVSLGRELAKVVWPAYYLDFETVMTVIPLYPGIAPYEQIPTQYSIHICSAPGEVEAHREYLADPARDCRRELAERLIADLSGDGSIVVYTNFEQKILNGLKSTCPDLADELDGCVERLFDLEAVIRRGFYHPDFKGRTSIKKTLPALVSGMSYTDLAIADGQTAMVMFARMARGECDAQESDKIRLDLLRYCCQDTMAMVQLHERLLKYA